MTAMVSRQHVLKDLGSQCILRDLEVRMYVRRCPPMHSPQDEIHAFSMYAAHLVAHPVAHSDAKLDGDGLLNVPGKRTRRMTFPSHPIPRMISAHTLSLALLATMPDLNLSRFPRVHAIRGSCSESSRTRSHPAPSLSEPATSS